MLVEVLLPVTALTVLMFLYVLYKAVRGESSILVLVVAVLAAVLSMVAAAGWSHPYVVALNGSLVELKEEAVTMSPLMSGISMISIALAVYVSVDAAYRVFTRR